MKTAKRSLAMLLALSILMSLILVAPVVTQATDGDTEVTDESQSTEGSETTEPVTPQTDKVYYLFGYINEANYGCEEDYENMGQYQFVDGQLTATFTTDSYVAVKEQDNANWYMFQSYVDTTSGTLYNTTTGTSEKMLVPGGVALTFTLVENEDGSLTLSYEEAVCEHDYTSKMTTAPTCTEAGVRTYVCLLCSDIYTETIPATGHTNDCKVNVATCLNYASYELTCTACGNVEVLYANELAYQGLDAIPNGMSPDLFTTDPLYRYRTQNLVTSLEPSMDGYTLYDTQWIEAGTSTVYYVTEWPAGFDTTHDLYAQYNNVDSKVSGYETEDAKLEINSDEIVGYLYYHWCYEGYPYTVAEGNDTYNRFHAYYSTVSPSEADGSDASDDSYRFDDSTACEDSVWYFYVPVYAQSATTYEKQYIFESWSDWSEWSTTPVTASSSREVETITGYRYADPVLGMHDYVDGFCTVCGEYDPDNIGYHLVGYINGADYGCEADYENRGIYRFKNGKLTATFTEPSYVFVKTSDNVNWYMAQGYVDSTGSIFYNTAETTASEKMYVPAGMEITFTLVENGDGTLTLSYVAAEPDCTHSYTSKVTTEPTCTTAGVETFTCTSCGHVYSEPIAATGHDNDCKVNAATCVSYASYELTCKVCGNVEVLYANELTMVGLDEVPSGMDPALFTTDPLYRFRTRKTATSYESTMEGYTLIGSTWVEKNSNTIYYVTEWPAGFDTTHELYAQYDNIDSKVTAYEDETSKLSIKTDKVVGYLYYHWCYDEHPNDWSSAVQDELFVNFCAFYSETAPGNYTCDHSDMSYKVGYDNCSSSNWYFVVTVYGQNYGEYEKQYNFENWSEWSEWSTTAVAANTNREVETITGYRYANAELADHSYVDGFCTGCGKADPDNIGYHLVGYINGANYGCEEDYANAGIYRFVDGKLTATFTEDSYVFIKTSDNANWYMFQQYCDAAIGTLYNTTTGTSEKMYVPGGVEVTFVLTEKADGSLLLSYSTPCQHSYTAKVTTAATCTTAGVKTYTCSVCGDSYTETIAATGHSYADGSCTICGAADPDYVQPNADYYLFGYINGANYGCEENAADLGVYKFVDGKLTATFTQDSYVAVKTGDNVNWYMFQSYVDTTSGTLYNTSTGTSEKMLVPGGVEVTFTLVKNTDGSLTLSYEVAEEPVVLPTLTLSYPTLAFEDEILYNAYFTIDDASSVVELGMITFSSKLTDGTIDDAVDVISGYYTSGSNYIVHSNGIPAKNLGDALYFKVYAKLSDGTYAYTDVAGYNAVAYAKTILNNASSSDKAKALVVAMLNYGAAAQVQFSYNTDSLMNASLTEEQLALVDAYDESMVDAVVKADSSKVGLFVHNGGYTKVYPTVSFEGAFAINYYFATANTPDSAPTFYYWDAETYANATELTAENATGTMDMVLDGDQWYGTVAGIAAKEIDQTYYTAGVYYVGDTAYYSPVVSYSLGNYCETLAAQDNAFGAATAVYGYYAKAYFA